MAISVTNSTAAYLGQISVSSVSTPFDAQGADTLVVAVGWTDSVDGTPSVSFGGMQMAALTSPAPVDANHSKVVVFVLSAPPSGSQPLVVAASAFVGNVQMNAVALKGAAGTIGQSGSAVAAGAIAPVTLTGTAAGSMILGFCLSFWLGAVETITADTGWTALATANGSNSAGNGFSASFQIGGGAASQAFTATPANGGYATYLAVAVEMQAAAAVSHPVPVTAATSAYLGALSTSAAASTAFDVQGGDFLVVAVSYADSAANTPVVTYGGVQMTPATNPRPTSTDIGAVALMILPNPPTGPQTLTVTAATFLGVTQVGAVAFSGAAGALGVRASLIEQASTAATLTLAATTAGSTLAAFALTAYGEPATLTPNYGWTQQATASGASASSFVYTSYLSGGDQTLVITPPAYTQFFLVALEVVATGYVAPSIPVKVVGAATTDLEVIGNGSGTASFDATGATLLLVAVAWENTTAPPILHYGGLPLTLLPSLTISNANVGTIGVAVLNNPPSGRQSVTAIGHAGYYGDTLVTLVALTGASGVAGVVASAYEAGHQLDLSLAGAQSTSLLLAFGMSGYARDAATVSEGWTTRASALGANANGWLWTAPGSPAAAIELLQNGYAQTQVLGLELRADLQTAPDRTGAAILVPSVPALVATGAQTAVPVPAGQVYQIYLETFFRELDPASNPQPWDFDLANIPAYCSTVVLFCARPQCAYQDLSSDLYATMSLNWPANHTLTSAQLLKATIALLKSRCPATKVLLGVQQYTADGLNNNLPYNPQGWAGMTAAHVANMARFLADMNMDGVFVDYECLYTAPQDTNLAQHCQTDPATGARTCYTDSEQVQVIKLIRAGIPRPYLLYMYGIHVGCYGEGPYADALPVSWNGGYNLCVAKDAAAVAALDGIHLGGYDADGTYDPRVALQAFQHWFPSTPIFMGLRAGPPDAGGIKRTLAELTDYTNCAVMRGAAGVYCYAMEWDMAQPSGNVSVLWPDATMISHMAATRLGLPDAGRPLISAPRTAPRSSSIPQTDAR